MPTSLSTLFARTSISTPTFWFSDTIMAALPLECDIDKFKSGFFNTSVEYWYTTYDAMFGSLLSNFFSGYSLWVAVYIIVPILLIFILPIIISRPKEIKKALLG